MEVSVRSSLNAIINKPIRDDGALDKKPKRDRKSQQKSKLDQRLRSICTKIDESNVKAGSRMAEGVDMIADFMFDNYSALKLNIGRWKLSLFQTPQTSIVFQLRSFSSTRLYCPSPMVLVKAWMAFCPKF